MRQAVNTRPITIYISEADFKRVKQITDEERISFAQWFRAAAKMKLEKDEQEDGNND